MNEFMTPPKMKHEIIELHDVQIIGMAKKIAFNEAKEECPKFWLHSALAQSQPCKKQP